MLRLIVRYRREERIVAIPDEGEATLGSASGNDIVLRIPGVSRRHALVRRSSGGVEFVDQRSKNGILVGGARVERTVLTPGLRLQLGSGWIEVEEVSAVGEALLRLLQDTSEDASAASETTAAVRPGVEPRPDIPEQAVLALAYHIVKVGVGSPEERRDLLFRIKTILGAEAFATIERTKRGRLRVLESVGKLTSPETAILNALANDNGMRSRDQVILRRSAHLLLAGRNPWVLAATFSSEELAREQWRKDLLRFLVSQFFPPVRSLDEQAFFEASRVLGLVRGNIRRTASLLGVSPGKLYKLLERFTPSARYPRK